MTATPQTATPTLRLSGVIAGRPWVRELDAGVYLLGSSRRCDVRLVGEGVSRQHATLRVDGGGVLVEDLGSKNGIFIDGRRVVRAVAPGGARLGIGRVELRVGRMVAGDELAIRFDDGGPSGSSGIETASETHWVDLQSLGPSSATKDRPAPPTLRFPSRYVPGRSPATVELYRRMTAVCRLRRPVLLHGETGVGKELLARTLHESSADPRAPYVVVNCAAIPENLLESEMFGIVRGAASGVEPRAGYFEQAAGGTLFLDELGELAPTLQAKLLRVLQEGEIQPVGGKPRRVDVWVVAATNVDLGSPSLRRDLFYRMAGGLIEVPPLREARDDIPLLVRPLLERAATEAAVVVRGMTRGALQRLCAADWPGNVRQLELVLQRAVSEVGESGVVDEQVFDRVLPRGEERSPKEPGGSDELDEVSNLELKPRVEALERRLIIEAMRRAGGRKIRAAELLGVSRSGLDKMLRRLEIGTSWAHEGERADSTR